MAVLIDLPPELLERVYHFLGSIDDVHHFGRACKSTYHIISRQTVYVEIMRSMIGQSPQHRFDLQLCKMLELHSNIARYFEQGGVPIPPTQPNPSGETLNQVESSLISAIMSSYCAFGPCTLCLPDHCIYEILARYQGLRFFQDLWIVRELKEKDFLAVDQSTDEDEIIERFNRIREREEDYHEGTSDVSARVSLHAESYCGFNADNSSRFYAAVVGVWLLNEIRWVLTHFTYPTANFTVQISLLDECTQRIHQQTETPLLDQLDRYAVFQYMYHHLLPLHAAFLADRDSSKLPLTFPSELEKSTVNCTRFLQLFLSAGQAYLQPPDIIDLVVRSTLSRKPPYPLMTVPSSTDQYVRPLNVSTFPSGHDYGSNGHALSHLFMRLTHTHLDIIKRSTINRHPLRELALSRPGPGEIFRVSDTHDDFFGDRALVEFEKHEQRNSQTDGDQKLQEARKVWTRNWPKIRWQIWWWANSEEKARAKMEIWRVPKVTTVVRRV